MKHDTVKEVVVGGDQGNRKVVPIEEYEGDLYQNLFEIAPCRCGLPIFLMWDYDMDTFGKEPIYSCMCPGYCLVLPTDHHTTVRWLDGTTETFKPGIFPSKTTDMH